MSFNRRGGSDRRPDRPQRDRSDRPRGEWEPREPRGGDRPYQPRGGDRPYQPRDPRGGDRPYPPRDRGFEPRGGDRPFTPRPGGGRPPQDEGGMSIRLDPRRVNALKHLAGETGMRPGDLVRQWVEERIDALRVGPSGKTLEDRVEELTARIGALESAAGISAPPAAAEPATQALAPEPGPAEPEPPDLEALVEAGLEPPDTRSAEPEPRSTAAEPEAEREPAAPKRRRNAVSATPGERVALHDEMIAVLRERGPMTAAELAAAVAERGRYTPPRSGKPLDAAMVSQRVSNPVYRSRFTRDSGRIGLAEGD